MVNDHVFGSDLTFRELYDSTVGILIDFVARHMPPWWVWPALVVIAFIAAWRVRVLSLRGLTVAPPADAERALALTAGHSMAARGTIGLVLGGGGAKGAYEVGCWTALRECGIGQFGAIAGTSVGALNAVLVAQDDYDKAKAIWQDMHFGRVLRLRWYTLVAVAIRVVLLVPYLGKHIYPARAIPVSLWRAVRTYQEGDRDGDPRHWLRAALELYQSFLASARSADTLANLVLGAIVVLGLSVWWVLAAPILTIIALVLVAPFIALLVVSYASMFASFLDHLSTRLALASNQPLNELLNDCVDVARLRERPAPLYVSLGTLREVTRTITPEIPARLLSKAVFDAQVRPEPAESHAPDRDFGHSLGAPLPWSKSTIEYVPCHFDVRTQNPARMRELILQSAGLPEIFPARRFDGVTYVDGGVADNEPLAALASIANHALIIVIPLDHRTDEAMVRKQLIANLERLDRPSPAALPELLVLTPSRALGNMLTGTLDFKAERARALMRLGYRDTIVRFAAHGSPKEALNDFVRSF